MIWSYNERKLNLFRFAFYAPTGTVEDDVKRGRALKAADSCHRPGTTAHNFLQFSYLGVTNTRGRFRDEHRETNANWNIEWAIHTNRRKWCAEKDSIHLFASAFKISSCSHPP